MPAAIPFISVFIVNYNTRALLERCLNSVFETMGHLEIEVFVADNNSTDGSAEMVRMRFPEVYLTAYSQNVGYTKAVNPLLVSAKGEYLLLLHADVELQPDTLSWFVEFFESQPQAGILGANLHYPDGTPNPCEILFPSFRNDLLSFAVRLFAKLPGGGKLLGNGNPMEWSHTSTSEVNWVWNACMIIRRRVLEEVGYFDERFFVWYADWDLCKRATEAGWLVYYLRSATAIHYERQSYGGGNIPTEAVRYKVDGWYSGIRQIEDRQRFLRKHSTPASVHAVKMIYVTEYALRLWLIVFNLLFRKASVKAACFQLKTCLQRIQAILNA